MYRAGTLPGLRVEHGPGAWGMLNGVEVRINRLGFRGSDPEMIKAPGVGLIAVTFLLLADEDVFAAERARLKELLGRLGIASVDPRPRFAGIPEQQLTVSASDFHPNARALGITVELRVGPVMGPPAGLPAPP
jgi:hypothetical protein